MAEIPFEVCNAILSGNADFPDVTPNPDVSGIGVLIGFLTPAYLTLALVIVYYLMGYIEDDFTNELDSLVIGKMSPKKYFGPLPKLETRLRRIILTFSDQQAVTGIALLGSGYAQLNSGIDRYHWQILVYLAWFSSLTHLTTLTVLRQHFLHNPAARLGRVVLMLITVAMLAIALLPTGDTQWSFGDDWGYRQSQGVPARCYFQRLGPYNHERHFDIRSLGSISMIISIFVLASGYLTRAVKLSDRATKITRLWFNEKPSSSLLCLRHCVLKRLKTPVPTNRKVQWVVGYISIETFDVWFKILYNVYASMLWEIVWLISALAWGTRNLLVVRVANNINAESAWGFGQIFVVILLVLPLLGTMETFYERQLSSRQEQEDEDESLSNNTPRHGTRTSIKKPPIILVGHWQARQEPSATKDSILLGHLRSRTEIRNGEQSMDVLPPRKSLQLDHTVVVKSEAQPAPDGHTVQNASSKYYQFQWFWIALATVLLVTIAAIIFVLAVTERAIRLLFIIPLAVGWIVVPTFWYSASFVTLSEFHAPLGTWIETCLGITRQQQKAILRLLTWCWPVITLAAMVSTEVGVLMVVRLE